MSCTRIEPADGERRRFVKNRLLVVAVSLGAWCLALWLAPYVYGGPVICPMHGLIGLPCMGCGLTRAFCELTRLNFAAAAALNALSFVVAVLFLAGPVVALVELARGERLRFYGFLFSTRVAYLFGATVAAYHVGRCAVLLYTGAMYAEYIRTSWTYALYAALAG
jgi:hypothetical protein